MNLPSLPTDNLYKFIGVTGLVLVVLSLYYPVVDWGKHYDLIYSYNGEVKILQKEKDILSEELKNIESEANFIAKKYGIKSPLIVTDSNYVFSRTIRGSKVEEGLTITIDKLLEQYNDHENKLALKSIELSNKKELIERTSADLTLSEILFYWVAGLGTIFSLFGFDNWYRKNQRIQDILQQNELLSKGIWSNHCQCCDRSLNISANKRGSETDGSISIRYCANCFQQGLFVEPHLELAQLKEKVRSDLKARGYYKLQVWFLLHRLKGLDRWRHKNLY